MFVLLIVASIGNGSIRANIFIQHLGCLNLKKKNVYDFKHVRPAGQYYTCQFCQ